MPEIFNFKQKRGTCDEYINIIKFCVFYSSDRAKMSEIENFIQIVFMHRNDNTVYKAKVVRVKLLKL